MDALAEASGWDIDNPHKSGFMSELFLRGLDFVDTDAERRFLRNVFLDIFDQRKRTVGRTSGSLSARPSGRRRVGDYGEYVRKRDGGDEYESGEEDDSPEDLGGGMRQSGGVRLYVLTMDLPPTVAAYRRFVPNLFNMRNFTDYMDGIVGSLLRRVTDGEMGDAADDCGILVDVAMADIWTRDENGLFVRTDTEGNRRVFQMGEPSFFADVVPKFHCYSTLLNANTGQCNKYIYDCLLSEDNGDLSKCLEFLTNTVYWNEFRNEINRMHPLIAYRTLQKFGFRKRSVYDDTAGRELFKVETYDHWVQERLTTLFSNARAINRIRGNDKLRCYLKLVIEFVNMNPGILNEDYTGDTNENCGVFQSSMVAVPAHIDPPVNGACCSDGSRIQANISSPASRSGFYVPMAHGFPGPVYGARPGSIIPRITVGSFGLSQNGGMLGENGQNGGNHCPPACPEHAGAAVLEGMFKGILREMEARGKTLAESDKKKINGLIYKLKSNQKQLIKYLNLVKALVQMRETFTGYASKILTLANIEAVVSKQRRLMSRQQKGEGNLHAICRGMNKLVSDNSSNNDYTNIGRDRKSVV